MSATQMWQILIVIVCTLGGAVISIYLAPDHDVVAKALFAFLGMILGAGFGATLAYSPAEAIAGLIRLVGKCLS